MCPSLRTTKSSHASGTNVRSGWAEKTKISAAQPMTGNHADRNAREARPACGRLLVHPRQDSGADGPPDGYHRGKVPLATGRTGRRGTEGTRDRMIRRHLMALRLALMLGDWVVAVLLVLLISLVRFGDGEASEFWRRLGIDIRLAAALFGIAWVIALWTQGLYRLRARWRLLTEARDIFRATILVAFVTMSALWFFKQENVSRLFLLALFIAAPLVTLAGRAVLRAWFGAFRRRGPTRATC